MNRMMVKSKVGGDGMLRLDLAIGAHEANKEVQVTVEPTPATITQEEWRSHILATAGSIPDTGFERPPQLPLAEREPLS